MRPRYQILPRALPSRLINVLEAVYSMFPSCLSLRLSAVPEEGGKLAFALLRQMKNDSRGSYETIGRARSALVC